MNFKSIAEYLLDATHAASIWVKLVANGGALGETSTTAYRGDRGKVAYDHTLASGIHVTAAEKSALAGMGTAPSQDNPIATKSDVRYKVDWSGRLFAGASLPIAASADRTAALTYGGVVTLDGIFDRSAAAGTFTLFNETGQLCIDHVQASASATTGQLRVTVTTSAGAFVVITTNASLTYGVPATIAVAVANPLGGSIGPSAVTVSVNGVNQALSTSTSYTGTILPTTSGILYLMGKDVSTQISKGFLHAVTWMNTSLSYSTPRAGSMASGATSDVRLPASLLYFRSIGKTISKVACGYYHTLVLTSDGVLYGMGRGDSGQLGSGTTAASTVTPVQIATGVASCAAGGYHSLYVTTGGTLYATGLNADGQLGNGSTTSAPSPVQIATGVASCAAGYYHSLYVKTTGVLWGMGRNDKGQLGNGSTTSVSTAGGVQIATGVASCAAGGYHSLYVTTGRALKGMGLNIRGQLGTGTTADVSTAGGVQITTGVASCSAAHYHSLYLTTGAVLRGMGENCYGQLGTGGNNDVSTAGGVQIAASVTSFTAGGESSFYITGGDLYAMGRNRHGQLGTGDKYDVVKPAGGVRVSTGVASCAAGGYHSLYATTGGNWYCLGGNESGQLSGHYVAGDMLADFTLVS